MGLLITVKDSKMFSKKAVFPIILFIFSTCFFYLINSSVKPFSEWPSIKYTTGDSTTYLNVGKWLIGDVEFSEVKGSVATRPFFYPLLVILLEKISPWAILVFQFVLWEIQILLVYFSGLIISKSSVASFFLSLFCVTILSPIGISLHVLTETTASFLLTLSFSILVLYLYRTKNNLLLFFQLLALSLCALVKPVYLYVFFADLLLLSILLFKEKKIFISIAAILTIFPIFFQLHIMDKKFQLKKISFIDTLAFNDYFFSKLELSKRKIENNPYSGRQIHAIREIRRNDLSRIINDYGYKNADLKIKKELYSTLTTFPKESVLLFIELILENTKQPSFFLPSNDFYPLITLWQSAITRFINLISLIIFLTVLFLKKEKKEYVVINILLSSTIFITYLSTGISFWQGDRFLVPIYFSSIFYFFFNLNRLFYTTKTSSN